MQEVPLQPIPAQIVKTVLADKIVTLKVYQLRYGMFIDVSINSELEIGAVICENMNRIIRSAYLNEEFSFGGDFVFQDTEGSRDPTFEGLGSRYKLLYLTQAELDAAGLSG